MIQKQAQSRSRRRSGPTAGTLPLATCLCLLLAATALTGSPETPRSQPAPAPHLEPPPSLRQKITERERQLRQDVLQLRVELERKERELLRLSGSDSGFDGKAAAVSDSSERQSVLRESVAPTSTLDRSTALQVAIASCLLVKGSTISSVTATRSMEPVISEYAFLLLEPAPFEDLRIGDIVTYRHPDLPIPVAHRILERRGDRFWTKGDNNAQMDNVYVTRENYLKRVFGIIYTQEPTHP